MGRVWKRLSLLRNLCLFNDGSTLWNAKYHTIVMVNNAILHLASTAIPGKFRTAKMYVRLREAETKSRNH